MPKTALIQVRIPFDLHEKAKAKSQEIGVTISFIVRQALEQWVEEDHESK